MAALSRTMVAIRTFEVEVRRFHMAGLALGLVHHYVGQEAVAAVVHPGSAIESPATTGCGQCIGKGRRFDQLFAEILWQVPDYGLGSTITYKSSIQATEQIFYPGNRNLATNSIVGGGLPLAISALAEGIVSQCLNMAAPWKLQIL